MPTDKRIERITRVLDSRQRDLRVVLEGLTIAHNASAVIRTCDAAGVLYLDLISPNPDLLPFNGAISTRADKWVEVSLHPTPAECLPRLKDEGFAIVATAQGLTKNISSKAKPFFGFFDIHHLDPLTVDEAAELTGFKQWTIRDGCNKGRIKAEKSPDRRWRISHEELLKIQNEGLPPE